MPLPGQIPVTKPVVVDGGLSVLSVTGKRRGLRAPYSAQAHGIDAGIAIAMIFDQVWSSTQRRRFATGLGVSIENARSFLILLAAWHDIGKATGCFSSFIDKSADGSETEAGFTGAVRHEVASGLHFLDWWRRNIGKVTPEALFVAHALAGHHGVFPNWTARTVPTPFERAGMGDGQWVRVRDELMTNAAEALIGPGWKGLLQRVKLKDGHAASIVLAQTGIIHADWLVSNKHNIKDDIKEIGAIATWMVARRDTIRKALARSGVIGKTPPPKSFVQRFPAFESPRGVQQLVDEVQALGPGAVFILDSPGSGKEATGLHVAANLAGEDDMMGIAVVKPTKATTTAEYGDVVEFCKHAYSGAVRLRLLHSSARNHDPYMATRKPQASDECCDQAHDSEATVETTWWLDSATTALFSPNVLGTIDQALKGVIAGRRAPMYLGALANKVLVIDEAHSYDAHMRTEVARLVHWIGHLGNSFVGVSATLPTNVLNELITSYREGCGAPLDQETLTAAPYPGIVHVARDTGELTALPLSGDRASAPTQLSLEPVEVPWGDDAADYRHRFRLAVEKTVRSEAGNLVVFCNSVTMAIGLYHHLERVFDGQFPINILHAALPRAERLRREKMFKATYGKGASSRPSRSVLICTQIAEQSFNVDFDLGMSENAPISWLIQRAGRIGRFASTPRPDGWKRRLIVFGGVNEDGEIAMSDRRPYDLVDLIATWEMLTRHTNGGSFNIRVPDDIQVIVDAVHRSASAPSVLLHSRAMKARVAADKNNIAATARADDKLIPDRRMLGAYAELTDGDHGASARDQMNVVAILPVWRDGARLFYDSPNGFQVTAQPDEVEAERIVGAIIEKSVYGTLGEELRSLGCQPPKWATVRGLQDVVAIEFERDDTASDREETWIASVGAVTLRLRKSSGLDIEYGENNVALPSRPVAA